MATMLCSEIICDKNYLPYRTRTVAVVDKNSTSGGGESKMPPRFLKIKVTYKIMRAQPAGRNFKLFDSYGMNEESNRIESNRMNQSIIE